MYYYDRKITCDFITEIKVLDMECRSGHLVMNLIFVKHSHQDLVYLYAFSYYAFQKVSPIYIHLKIMFHELN